MRVLALALAVTLALAACGQRTKTQEEMVSEPPSASTALATFGGGCFWCTEAVFQELDGVLSVESGYSGGTTKDPSYKEVCTGTTGHAEAVQVRYDPSKVTYAQILEVFFKTHDPTTLDRQGADVGTQYRSVIFTHTDEQKAVAEAVKRDLDASGAYDAPIVTQIVPFETFYPAEDYHQDFFANNPNQGYCRAVIQPKLEKFRKVFADRLKRAE